MSSVEDRVKHSRRIKAKLKERQRSVIAKELIVSGKYKQRVVQTKKGKEIDLEKFSFRDLVEAINEDQE